MPTSSDSYFLTPHPVPSRLTLSPPPREGTVSLILGVGVLDSYFSSVNMCFHLIFGSLLTNILMVRNLFPRAEIQLMMLSPHKTGVSLGRTQQETAAQGPASPA